MMIIEGLPQLVEQELVRLVGIYSPSGDEAEIVGYVFDRLAGLGLTPRRVPTPGGHDNVVAGATDPHLVITAHLDTIRPTWAWNGEAEIGPGVVRGLGAVDDKGGVAAALLGLEVVARVDVDVAESGVAVAFTVDEEINGTGSLAVAEALRPQSVIALEGTGLAPGIAGAGVVAGSVDVWGRAAHGSLPEFGDNAIVKAARLILELEQADFTKVVHPLTGATLPCVEEISGGSRLFAVPGRASLRFDIRVSPGIGAQAVADEVRRICARHDAAVAFEEVADAFETPEESALVEALRASTRRILGAARPVVGVPSWTDAHNFVAEGSQAIVFGPGKLIGSAHQANEYVEIDEVAAAAQILSDLIVREAAGLLS